MAQEPAKPGARRRPSSILPTKLDELGQLFEQQFPDAASVLEVLISAKAKGHDTRLVWNQLHAGAVRHDKIAELAFAYEHVLLEKRVKLLAPETQAEVYVHAVRFFSEMFGDSDGAIGYAERALAAVPGHPEAFTALETLLTEAEQPLRLAKLYVDASAVERDKDQQLIFLGRAAELVDEQAGAEELSVDIFQRTLRVEPRATATRRALEQLLTAQGRVRDAARLLEQAFTLDPPLPDEEAQPLRERLIEIHVRELRDPKQSIGHVEALLARQPGHELARSVAESLLENKAVMPRAIAALGDAYEKLGQLDAAAALLAQELRIVRGPRRIEVQRRLGILRQDVFGDLSGALELLAPVVAGDPGDDALRRRFVELHTSLGQPLEAARLLQRALGSARDPGARARVCAEIGAIFGRAGDAKAAHTAFQQVLEIGQDEGAMLEAARHLAEMHAEAHELDALARVLELTVRLEPEREARQAAARRLARLCEGELNDPTRAIPAYRGLIGSPWTDEALRKLESLCEQADDVEGLIEALERRAERTREPAEARALAFRAAELRSTRTRDAAGALLSWRLLSQKYGASSEINARLIPLLEQAGEWNELLAMLDAEINSAARPEERAALLAQAAQIRLGRTGDPTGALQLFRQALAIDPSEPTSRNAVERLLGTRDHKLPAAEILEPIYRREHDIAGLLRALDVHASTDPDPLGRLRALREACAIAETELNDPARALPLAGKALALAVDVEPSEIPAWLERARHAGAAVDPTAYAGALADALGERAVTSPDLAMLARQAADALVACGDIPRAIELLRRSLQFEHSAELVVRVDELLAQQGSPEERLTLYREALGRETDRARRRELLHAIATVQRRDLHDAVAALETWRHVAEEDPRDLTAHQALLSAYEEAADWDGAYSELDRVLAHLEGERRSVTLLRMAELSAEHGQPQRALIHYRELMASAELADDVLEIIEQLARENDDAATTRAVLERRLSGASSADRRAELLERLGNVLAWQLDDSAAAAEVWLEGARLSEAGAVNAERATRLYERVLGALPDHREAAERLIQLNASAGQWQALLEPFEALLRIAPDDALRTVIELEAPALAAGAVLPLVDLLDAALAIRPGPAPARRLAQIKARSLAQLPERHDDAAHTYRALLESGAEDEAPLADAFDGFLREAPHSPQRIEDRRWLYAWRAERSADPATVLHGWAIAEEHEFGDPTAAVALYERVIGIDPERSDALTQLARLRSERGDAEGALGNLEVLRERSAGEARTAVERAMAILLIEQLGRPREALSLVEPLLLAAPSDGEVLRVVHGALGHAETRVAAAGMLERVAETSDDPRLRERTLERLLEISSGVPELAEPRARWTKRLLEARGDDPEATMAVALQAAEQLVTDEELWGIAERCARRLDRPGPVGEAYARVITSELSPETAEALGRRIVEFHEEWFDAPERVVELLERVLLLSPGASWALDRLKLAFNAAGRWTELFTLYDRALEHASGAGRIELLREAAMAARDFAGEGERAIGYLEQLDQASPGDARVEASLERLYERHTRVEPLIALLERRLESGDAAARRDLRSRIAGLYLDLGDVPPAFELAQALLAETPEAPDTIALLERLIATPAAKDSIVPPPPEAQKKKKKAKTGAKDSVDSVRDRAASHLKRHYETVGKIADVVRMLEIEVEVAPNAEERRARLGAIVAMRIDDLGDLEGAFQSLSELVRLAPGEPDHRARLALIASRIGADSRRAELLISVAEGAGDPALRAELLLEAAGVHQHLLGDGERATALHLDVLALSDHARSAALAAARELDGLLEAAGRAKERCTVLEQLAKLESDREARRRALGNAALVATSALADPDRAVRAWRARLHDDDQDAEALDGLCAALEAGSRWDELVRALEKRAAAAERASSHRDRVSIARIHAEHRGDRSLAIEAWRGVRQSYGPDLENSEALSALLEAEQRYEELAQHLAEEGGREQDPVRRAELYRKLGEVLRSRLGDSLRALNAFVWAGDWERAIEVAGATGHDPERGLEVCRSLLDVAVDAWQKDPASGSGPETAAGWAIDELGARLRDQGRFADLVELLLRASRLPLSRRRARELKREAACLYSDRLDDVGRAIETFQELFREDAADDVAGASVTRLALLLEEQGRLPELVALWEEQARARAAGGDAATGAALWARAAQLAEEQLGDVERAILGHREGAGLGGEESLEALARIYEGRGENRRAAEVLEWLCQQSSKDRLADRALRLADAYLAAGDRRRARARLESAAIEAIDAAAVRQRLAELYRQSEDWGPLAELLSIEAARAPDRKRRIELLREAASLHGDRRDDPLAAVPLLEQAVEADPEDPELRLSLADVLRRSGQLDRARAALEAQIQRYGNRRPKARALVHLSLARVALAADASGEALSELEIATKIDPAHSGILELTAELAFERGELDRAERVYRALLLVIGREGDGPSRAEALLALSEIAGRRDDPTRAAEFVESAFEAAFDSEREAACLEKALKRRGKADLVGRAVELRLKSATDPGRAARALADFVFLHQTPSDVPAGLLERAHAIERELEQRAPEDFTAWTALGKVYDWLGDREAEARILERRVGALPASASPEDAEPLYRLAGIRLGDPSRRDHGLALLERALELKADPARTAEVLRAAFGDQPSDERAVRLLERVARTTGDQRALASALALRVRQPGAADARALREAVELALELADHALAESVLRIGTQSDVVLPADAAAWVRLELAGLCKARGDAAEALDLREQAATFLGGEGRNALLEVAREASASGDFGRATRIYRQLFSREPGDREVWEPLLELYRQQREHARLIELIELTVPLLDSRADRMRLRLEQATLLLGEGGDGDAASVILRQILDEDPTEQTAANLLAGILAQTGRLDELCGLLMTQLDAAKDRQDTAAIVALSLRLGELFEKLERPADALDVYRSAIDWDGRCRTALEALLRLGKANNDGFVVADALTGLLDARAIEDPEAVAFELAQLRRDQDDDAGIERALSAGFAALPTSATLREALLERYRARADRPAAAALLRRAVEAAPADMELLQHMIAEHRAAEEQEAALEVVDRRLAQAPSALLYRERATLLSELHRDDEALADLERAHAASGDQPELLIEALERAIARAEPPEDVALTLRLTQILEDIGDEEGARARLAELVKQAPANQEALARSIALERRAENWDSACTLLIRRAGSVTGPALIPIALELADVGERAGRLADVRAPLERALELEPRNPELRQRLRAVYAAGSSTPELARLLIEDAELESDPARRHGHLLAAGELLLGAASDAEGAIRILTEARELNPDSIEGAVLLARAYAADEHSTPALDLLGSVVLAHRGRRSKQLAQVYQEISSIQLMQGFLSEAMDSLTKAFEMDVRNGQLAMQLAQLALDIDEEETALRAFRSVTMMKPAESDPCDGATAAAKSEAHFQLARIAFKRGDPRKAKLLATKALAENPALEPARLLLLDLEAAERRA